MEFATAYALHVPVQHPQPVQDDENRAAFMPDYALRDSDGLREVQNQQDNDDADRKVHILFDNPLHWIQPFAQWEIRHFQPAAGQRRWYSNPSRTDIRWVPA
jgi:hypothetical protein